MIRRGVAAVTLAAVMGTWCGGTALGSQQAKWKPSKSDADVKKIGHRDVGKGTNFYSFAQEKKCSEQLAKQIERESKFVDDAEVVDYVDRIGQRVARNSDIRMPVNFRVIDSDAEEAFTLPGGYQYVDRGLLLRVESEAELAGVLAHGIAHTAIRSGTKEATEADIARIATMPGDIFIAGERVGSPVSQRMSFPLPLMMLAVRREDELEADYFGLQYVYVTGYDPEGYIDVLQRVSTQTRSSAASTDVFSASPPLDKRIEAMRKEIAEILPKRSDAVVSTPEFKEFQDRVRAWKPGPTSQ